jgi:hypothetical protein
MIMLAAATLTCPAADDPARLARIHAAKMPAVKEPVMFNTPAADAILAALEVFPANNPWNQLVTDWPVAENSRKMVATIGETKPLRANTDMAFILVPPDQPLVEVKLTEYPDESDKGPFPFPPNTPIEGWPADYARNPKTKGQTLAEVQADVLKLGGDRHAIVVDPTRRLLYETWVTQRKDGAWTASCAAKFDLKTNKLRPDGWTSSDAAGLPIFPAIVRYDELQRGSIDHALRVTVRKTRKAYVAPATHFASNRNDPDLPRMGERLRLRQDFDVSGFPPHAQVILKALKIHGMFVADNGGNWLISIAPDFRIKGLDSLAKVKGSDFEVVEPSPAPR